MHLTPFISELLVRGVVMSGIAGAVAWSLRGHGRTTASAAGLCALLALPAAMLLPGWRVSLAGSGTSISEASGSAGWLQVIGFVWLGGFLLAASRIVPGMLRLRQWCKAAEPLEDDRVLRLAEEARAALGLRRLPRLLLRAPGSMPLACGMTRGVIFLPDDALEWSDECLQVVLLHEMAHLRRRDPAMQVFAWLACAMHWFNPLVWFLHRVWMRGREHATDALVLTTGVRPRGYAAHLLEIACSRSLASAMPAPAMAAGGLEQRVISILKWTAPARRGPALPAVVICLAGAAGVFAASFLHLVPVEQNGPQISDAMLKEVQLRLSADPFPGS